jgi:polysaccharide export outer membrane protein
VNIDITNITTNLPSLMGKLKKPLLIFVISTSLSGCSNIMPEWFGSEGPTNGQVQDKRDDLRLNGIQLVDVDGNVAQKLVAMRKQGLLSDYFGDATQSGYVVGAGDVVELTVWESPPAMLFSAGAITPGMSPSSAQGTTFPAQMVSREGTINIPFAGQIVAAGQSTHQIETEIVRRLTDKANQPQALVRVVSNNTANVTVVGEVATSARMPLTARGERLLDALAAAGGVRQPVEKISLQITRGNQVRGLALDSIIRDPKQNILLQPGDVITALFQPLSFTALGATSKNQEVNFEAQGINLAQALARAGGLLNERSDARAVFIFRFEDKKALDWATPPKLSAEGKVPVIYQINMKDPASFLIAQNFPIDNKDVLYVSNAPGDNFKKFVAILYQSIFILKSIGSFSGF